MSKRIPKMRRWDDDDYDAYENMDRKSRERALRESRRRKNEELEIEEDAEVYVPKHRQR